MTLKKFCLFFALFVCSKAQEWIENTDGKYEYYYDELEVVNSYDEAVGECANKDPDATLVVITTEEIQNFILGLPGEKRTVLIGLQRTGIFRYNFTWVDGTPVEDGYTNWDEFHGEPTNGFQEDCVILDGSPLQWKDYPCGGSFWYMCQRKTENIRTSTTKLSTESTSHSDPNEEGPSGSCISACVYTESEEFIITVSVSGGVIGILLVIIGCLLCVIYSHKDNRKKDRDSLRKTNSETTLTNGQTNMAYMWNSLPSEKDSKLLRRDIPRPSVVGSTSTISYYNKAFNRTPYNEGGLDFLPEDKEHTLSSQVDHGDHNHMYSKLSMMR